MVRLFAFLMILLAGLANAGTMTACSGLRFPLFLSQNNNIYITFGQCTMSTSYANPDGDVFPGTDTAAKNAATILCQDANYHILRVITNARLVLSNFDSTNYSFHVYYPTSISGVTPVVTGGNVFAGDAFTLTGSVAAPVLTGTPAVLTGSVAAPKINTTTDAVPDEVLSIKSGALSSISGIDDVTGIQAPALTMNSYTPAGTLNAPALTMNNYTPTGIISTPIIGALNATAIAAEVTNAVDVHTASPEWIAFCSMN